MKNLPLGTVHVTTRQRSQIIDITSMVQGCARGNAVKSGMAIVYVPHTTAGVTINENADPDVKTDMLRKLEAMIPKDEGYYQHGEGNSDSHVKTALVGNSATVLIENGNLVLGTWQGIYFCEFDGPRERKVLVKILGFEG